MEIDFPIEFLVSGTPVSWQSKRAKSKAQWKDSVRSAGSVVLPSPHFASASRIAVTLFYFPDAPMQGDVDNIVKLVLDAMARHIYLEDRQVERVVMQKFEPGNAHRFAAPSAKLSEALVHQKPVLYIRLSDDPFEDL